jgi:hypothetical protein
LCFVCTAVFLLGLAGGQSSDKTVLCNLAPTKFMAFFTAAIDTLKVLVIALGAGLGVWGVINLLEGYGNDNPGANAHVR